MMRYRFYRSWKAYTMLTRKGCLSCASRFLSFMTEGTLFFVMMLH